MEFFDFTGTNEEEKAQALDIIQTHDSSGVEFFLNYNTANFFHYHHPHSHSSLRNSNTNNNNEHSKSTSYLHANGDIPRQNQHNTNANHNQNNINNNNNNNNDDNHLIENSTQVTSQNNNNTTTTNNNNNYPIIEWELTNNESNTAAANTNVSLVTNMQQMAQAAAAAANAPQPQYLFPGAHPYFTAAAHHGPPNPYAIHALHTPLGPHQVNHQSKQICIPPVQIVPSSLNNNNNTTTNNNNTNNNNNNNKNNPSKNTTVNSSSCDIRNYMPSSQYSDRPSIMDNNHLKNTSLSVSADGGNIISDSLVSNGSAAVPTVQHIGPHGYPSYAFQTHALPFPHHSPFTPQIYYLSDTHLLYTPFSPTTAIPATAHIPNVITSSTSADIATTNSNQVVPSTGHQTASSSTVATSNLSSMSASSSSIAAQYHSSSSSSETPAFETNDNYNQTYDNSGKAYKNTNSVTDKMDELTTQVPSIESSSLASPKQDSNESLNSKTDENSSPASKSTLMDENKTDNEQISKNSTLTMNNNDSMEKEKLSTNDTSNNNNNNLTEISQVTSTKTDPSVIKPTTWASKLFPTNHQISTNNNNNTENGPSHSSSNKSNSNEELKISSDNNILNSNEVKSSTSSSSNLQNGEYPELNVHVKYNSNSNNNNNIVNNNYRRTGRSSMNDNKKLTIISMKNDPIAFKLAKRLRDSIHLKHSLPTIMPCGLINRGNWCYVNATLQALLACPPFYNLMREISETPGLFRQSTATPIIDNFARYFAKFLPCDYKRQMKSGFSPYLEELLNSEPFEPVFIYDTLKHIGMIKSDAQRGHQEDAEEFLSSVLNGLNEEMINLMKLLDETNKNNKITDKANGYGSDEDLFNEDNLFTNDNDDSNDIWHEVGTSKHKSLPTRSTKVISTLITEIFGGSTLDIRTVNKDKDSSGNRQPFFTLQLDIKPSMIRTLDDAIRWQTKSETIHGYTCSKTKQLIEANSQMFLENLPPILIFHLKLFDYDIETGVTKKLFKIIDFSENFEIPRECITGKGDNRCRRYKLLAVVYHDGSEVVNGHYITDVYHLGLNQWLRCDDASIKVISLTKVLTGNEGHNQVPYLLFYRRYDTLHSNNNNNNNNISSNNHNSINAGTNGAKRSSNNHLDYGHNYSISHDSSHNDMLTNNKFNSISRQY